MPHYWLSSAVSHETIYTHTQKGTQQIVFVCICAYIIYIYQHMYVTNETTENDTLRVGENKKGSKKYLGGAREKKGREKVL